jgi:hypothetical protein
MQTTLWETWELLLDFLCPVNPPPRPEARNNKDVVDHWVFRGLVMVVVDRVVVKTAQFSLWRTWVWLWENMVSMSSAGSSIVEAMIY